MAETITTAIFNVIILVGIPLLPYFLYHKLRHKRSMVEVLKRAGLQVGEVKYLVYCLIFAAVNVVAFILWKPPLEALTQEGSAWTKFVGLGLNQDSVARALLYGVVMTGFCEEFLFRGLIAGSLSRRLPLVWANVIQATIFLAPHLLFLGAMGELWFMLIFVFAFGLVGGWARIKSGSILGPWIIHAAGNTTTALMVAIRSAE